MNGPSPAWPWPSVIAYISVLNKAKELKFLPELDKTLKIFVVNFMMDSINRLKKNSYFTRKNFFLCFLGWFLEYYFELKEF